MTAGISDIYNTCTTFNYLKKEKVFVDFLFYFKVNRLFFLFIKKKKLRRLPNPEDLKKKSLLFNIFNSKYFFKKKKAFSQIFKKINFNLNISLLTKFFLINYKKTIGHGFDYIKGLFIIFFFDATFTDDEPL